MIAKIFHAICLIFTNDAISSSKIAELIKQDYGDEEFYAGKECLNMYLPHDSKKN